MKWVTQKLVVIVLISISQIVFPAGILQPPFFSHEWLVIAVYATRRIQRVLGLAICHMDRLAWSLHTSLRLVMITSQFIQRSSVFCSMPLILLADCTINKANLKNGGLVRLAMPTKFVKTVLLNSILVGHLPRTL